MAKVVGVNSEEKTVALGLPDGSVRTVPLSSFQYGPLRIGDVVELFEGEGQLYVLRGSEPLPSDDTPSPKPDGADKNDPPASAQSVDKPPKPADAPTGGVTAAKPSSLQTSASESGNSPEKKKPRVAMGCLGVFLALTVLSQCGRACSQSSSTRTQAPRAPQTASSVGKETVKMPNLTHRPLKDAADELRALGIEEWIVVGEDGIKATGYPDDIKVSDQEPKWGESITEGKPITVTIDWDEEKRAEEERHAAEKKEREAEEAKDDAARDAAAAVQGMDALESEAALQQQGYEVGFVYDGQTEDFTDEVHWWYEERGPNDTGYTVTGYESVSVDPAKIVLKVRDPAEIAAVNQQKQMEAELEKKLSSDAALDAVYWYGREQYPYGFEINWVFGKLASYASDANTWTFKYRVTITNKFGASYETDMEARVTGTTGNPIVSYFLVR